MERATKKEHHMVVSMDNSQCELIQVLTLTERKEIVSQNVRRDWRRRRRRRIFCPLISPAAAIIAYLIYARVGMVMAVCPNMCSGHGECGLENKCECEEGWDVVPDCSLKACPTGVSWGGKAYEENKAHTVMECSNVGICDRALGVCECPAGYTGSACQRLACPNNCSGQGTCLTLAQAAEFYGTTSNGGVGSFSYVNWEADMVMTCICDWGYSGADCSLRMCPKGDDPITTLQNYPSLSMTTNATAGVMQGNFVFTFHFIVGSDIVNHSACTSSTRTARGMGVKGESFSFPANATQFNSSECEAALEGLDNLEDVTCSRESLAAMGGATFHIELVAFPTFPHQNNVFSHDGWPGLDAFSCSAANVTGATDPTCTFAVLNVSNLREYQYCSRRGICDFETGRCECADGFSQANCDMADSVIMEGFDEDVLRLVSTMDNFTGNVLYLKTERSANSYFNLIKAASGGENTFTLSGDGTLRIFKGDLVIDQGTASIYGEVTASGGITIAGGDLNILVGDETIDAGDLTLTQGSIYATSGSLTVAGITTSAPLTVNSDMIGSGTLYTGGISSSNSVTVSSGGLDIIGGLTIQSGGATIEAGGLMIGAGGLDVTGLATIATNDLIVSAGDLNVSLGAVTVGSTVTAAGMTSSEAVTVTSGGITISGGNLAVSSGSISSNSTVTAAGMSSSAAVTITAGGIHVTGGATVNTGSLTVSSGSVTASGMIASNGLSSSSDVNVTSGNLAVDTGSITAASGTVTAAGMTSSSTVTVSADGMDVIGGVAINTGDLTVTDGNIYVTNGAIISGNDVTTSGLITSSGVISNGAITVVSGGMDVTGAVTASSSVSAAGMTSSAAVTISTGDLTVTAGTITAGGTLTAAGVTSNGAITVTSGGMDVTDGNIVVSSGRITAGSWVDAAGMISSAGLSVSAGGLHVVDGGIIATGDLTVSEGNLEVTLGAITVGGAVTSGGTVSAVGMSSTADVTVTGDITIFGISTAYSHSDTSDSRLKEAIAPLRGTLSTIARIRGVSFQWKDNAPGLSTSDIERPQRQLGFIAQEVRDVLPELVHRPGGGPEGYLAVKYAGFTPLLVEGLKELDDIVSGQQQKTDDMITALGTRLTALEDAVRSLQEAVEQIRLMVEDRETGRV